MSHEYINENNEIKLSKLNVFKCPNCHFLFSKSKEYLPLSLPCGHVVCKSCLSKTNNSSDSYCICPIDKKLFSLNIESLNICQALFKNINEKKNKEFICITHPNKRIKYLCEYDNSVFCTKCLKEHNKSPHKVINFEPNRKIIRDEINLINQNLIKLKNNIKISEQRLDVYESVIQNKMLYEVGKLNNEINGIIYIFSTIKKECENKIQNLFKTQIKLLNDKKSKLIVQKESLDNIEKLIRFFGRKYFDKNNIIYNDLVIEKNNIISQYENYVHSSILDNKNFELEMKNFLLPKIIYNKDKINENLIQKFTSFETESYKENSDVIDKNNNKFNFVNSGNITTSNSNQNINRYNIDESLDLPKHSKIKCIISNQRSESCRLKERKYKKDKEKISSNSNNVQIERNKRIFIDINPSYKEYKPICIKDDNKKSSIISSIYSRMEPKNNNNIIKSKPTYINFNKNTAESLVTGKVATSPSTRKSNYLAEFSN